MSTQGIGFIDDTGALVLSEIAPQDAVAGEEICQGGLTQEAELPLAGRTFQGPLTLLRALSCDNVSCAATFQATTICLLFDDSRNPETTFDRLHVSRSSHAVSPDGACARSARTALSACFFPVDFRSGAIDLCPFLRRII